MAQYVLVYKLEGYREDGAGTYSEQFGMDEYKMHKFVQKLVTEYKERFKLVFAGFLQKEYTYETIEYAVRVEHKLKD
jgi:hypothetical protein